MMVLEKSLICTPCAASFMPRLFISRHTWEQKKNLYVRGYPRSRGERDRFLKPDNRHRSCTDQQGRYELEAKDPTFAQNVPAEWSKYSEINSDIVC